MLQGAAFFFHRMRVEGAVWSNTAYSAPFCSTYACTRRTPCGFEMRTVTGVLVPMELTAGAMLRAV